MSSRIIPRDQLGAYRLWELDSLEKRALPQPEAAREEAPPLAWPTATELEEIQRQAHEEGFAAGREEGLVAGKQEGLVTGREEGLAAGREEGFAAGRDEGYRVGYGEGHEKSLDEWARIKQLAVALDEALEHFDRQLGQDLLDLALALARQVMRSALKFRPEAVLPVIREALAGLPQPSQHSQLILNPEDAALVRTTMEEELSHVHCRIVEDSHIERGGCRVKTDASEVDATLQGRWARAVAALGRDGKWLD